MLRSFVSDKTGNRVSLKAQGARFPEAKEATPVFTPAGASESYRASASGSSAGLRGGNGGGGGGGSDAEASPQTMEKLEEDLQVRFCCVSCLLLVVASVAWRT